ncbi:hypothetical protein BJ138DRAFT_666795 [Hygrophoropsis aurantiaca]|uniref:Uncharacterized protein n=1 Tax=Hygrophoropsis aurantiaca TaxID=72124 RepID=A0ACB7ZYD7_9AGAM|nr:hypothetical protein BJ138DRAFT_666795 [Hygrophoropsis aurantiaca]
MKSVHHNINNLIDTGINKWVPLIDAGANNSTSLVDAGANNYISPVDPESTLHRTGFHSLPVELVQKIFSAGWKDDQFNRIGQRVYTTPFEVIVSHVSAHWRDIALDTPLLWSAIRFTPQSYKARIFAYIARSKERPLSIVIGDIGSMHMERAISTLHLCFHRLRKIRVEAMYQQDLFRFLTLLDNYSLPLLEGLEAGGSCSRRVSDSARMQPCVMKGKMPSLTSLLFDNFQMPVFCVNSQIKSLHLHSFTSKPISINHTIDILTRCSDSLEELCTNTCHFSRDLGSCNVVELQLPAMRRLTLVVPPAGTSLLNALMLFRCPRLDEVTLINTDREAVYLFIEICSHYNFFVSVETLVMLQSYLDVPMIGLLFSVMPKLSALHVSGHEFHRQNQ